MLKFIIVFVDLTSADVVEPFALGVYDKEERAIETLEIAAVEYLKTREITDCVIVKQTESRLYITRAVTTITRGWLVNTTVESMTPVGFVHIMRARIPAVDSTVSACHLQTNVDTDDTGPTHIEFNTILSRLVELSDRVNNQDETIKHLQRKVLGKSLSEARLTSENKVLRDEYTVPDLTASLKRSRVNELATAITKYDRRRLRVTGYYIPAVQNTVPESVVQTL